MSRPKQPITNCPKSSDGTCDRSHYAKGLCKSCYNASKRTIADAHYEAKPQAKARKQRYEKSPKGRDRKRKWWRENRSKQK